ncbi:MAG: class I SAM-dependent methyltransferase [Bacteroidales bacterium]|nr:class I SAM-dependent methyltransferase [Bacteroidales bacterium]
MKLIETTCYNCGSGKYELYDSENGFNLVKCSVCGLLYVNPRPSSDDISLAMATGLHKGEKVINCTGRYNAEKIKKYIRVLNEFYPKDRCNLCEKKWLDIGCGFGELIEALRIYTGGTLNTIGSEPNMVKVSYARSNNLNVSFIDLSSHKDKYDVISLLNVYSHIPNPIQFILDLKKNLTPTGEIFLETGHTCHLSAKNHRRPYQLPDHLHFANLGIVVDIFKRLGFDIVHVNTYRYEFFPYTFNLWKFAKEVIKVILRKRKDMSGLFPRFPKQDMFLRCKLVMNS